MKNLFLARLLMALCFFLLFAVTPGVWAQTIITQWNFNSTTPDGTPSTGTITPSTGSGSLTLVGGTSATFVSGAGSSDTAPAGDDSSWDLTAFPTVSAANKTAGLEGRVNTTGFQSLTITWDQDFSGTAANRARLQYSANGGATYTDFTGFTSANGTAWVKTNSINLSAVTGLNNNPNVRFRIVSEFSTPAATPTSYSAAGTGSTYSGGGNWHFDMLTVRGTACPAITATLAGTTTICTGSSTNLIATITGGTGPYSLTYSDGTTNTVVSSYVSGVNIPASPASTKTYTIVAVTANNGCPGTITGAGAIVTANSPPTVANAGASQTITAGNSATLTANAPTTGTGSWSVTSGPSTASVQFSGTSSPTATFMPAGGAGDYVLTWTISNAPCTPSASTVTITVNAAPPLPVHNLTQNTFFATIQPAITAAVANDIIELAAQTFNERITINKALTLTGVNSLSSIMDGTGLGNGSGILLVNGVTGVTIKKMTVRNFAANGPNANGGIYAPGGNNSLTVDDVKLLDNVGGSGFYANGPVSNVSITNSTVSGHTNAFGAARGIVIWNGFKQNITITGNTVTGNNCCGIELQEGTASGVTISGNTVTTNGDNAIGLVGLTSGAGPNVIANNIVTDNGRFGIEIKVPNGTGLTSGDGSIVVENNTVMRTAAIVDVRDIAGIAVFRRGYIVGNNNVDIPTGVVVRNNTVSGYQQPSTSDGFGIVIEGTNHTVTGNTVSNNDVGVQQQAGNLPYTANAAIDGDQSNVADTYFGRGNSPVACGNTVSGNTFSGNGTNSRNVGAGAGQSGIVKNTTTGGFFCTIQSAVNAATAGNSLSVSAGTFDELVTVGKSLTITGSGVASTTLTFSGTVPASTMASLIKVEAANVAIRNLSFTVNQNKTHSAIHTSGDCPNLTVTGNTITAAVTAAIPGGNLGYGRRNAIAVNPNLSADGYTQSATGFAGVLVKNNVVTGSGPILTGQPNFRAAVQMDLSGGTIENNTLTAINHDVVARFCNQGAVTIQNNTLLGGGVQLTEFNAGAGPITVSNNTFNGSNVHPASGALGTGALLRLQNNVTGPPIGVAVANNTFSNHRWGASVENFTNVTFNANTFTPLAGSTDYRHVSFNTKLISSSSIIAPLLNSGATLTNNTFNGSGAAGGTAIAFFNHREDGAAPTIGTYVLGQAGQENTFNAGIATLLRLDNSTGPSTGFVSPFNDYNSIPSTTMKYWTPDLNAVNNKVDLGTGLKLVNTLTSAERTTLNGLLFDKSDDANVGRILIYLPVHNVTQNTDFATIQNAVDAATAGDVLLAAAGTYAENVTISKPLTINGANAGVNPNTGSRGAETIVVPAVNSADPDNGTSVVFQLSNASANVTLDGLLIDGDNPALSGGLVINSADINAIAGVSGYGFDVNGLTVKNSIIRNFTGDGVDLGGAQGLASSHQFLNNRFDNIAGQANTTGSGQAIYIGDNAYPTITNNVITRVLVGVQTGNFYRASPSGTPSVSNNTISAYRIGIYHNLQYSGATAFTLSGNTISANATLSGVIPNSGLRLYSIQQAVGATALNNTVNAGFLYGVHAWNTPSTGDVNVTGGSVQGSVAGIRLTNRTGFNGGSNPTGSNGRLAVSGVTVTNSPIGAQSFDDPDDTQNTGVVSLTVTGNTQITGTGAFTAVSISGADASATIIGNASSFTGNGSGVGVDVNGGMASVNTSRISNFATGVSVSNGGRLTGAANNFIIGNAVSGVTYAGDANATQGMVTNNDLSGNVSKAIINGLASTTIGATCNWYGTSSPTVALFTGPVTYSPYLNTGTDNEAGTAGFQPVPASCVTNQPPVATANTNQTATVGTAFSYMVAAFSDETPASLTYTASIAPVNGFTFNAATRVITGMPTSTGVSSVTVTATDAGSLSASTTFTITVSPAPVVVTSLSLVVTASPTTLLTTGGTTLSATVTGGTPSYSYVFSGPGVISQATNSNTASVSGLSAGVQTFTVVVSDATSQTISGTVGVTVNAANQPPVATANVNQTATVGVAFSYTVAAFSDETPASLTYTTSISPVNGFTFNAATRVITGTPSVSGVSSVTVTASDPGSLSASTTFTITVSPASVTVAGPFSITGVTTVSCTTTSAGQRQLTFTPLYGGVNGQTISFRVVNEMLPTTAPGPYVLNPYIDNSTFALRATQSGTAGEVSFSYNWLAACNGVSPPVNQAPTTTGIANQTGTTGVGFSLNVASSFSDPNGDALVFTATGLPSGLSLSGSTISGVPSVSGVSSVTVTATDPGSLSVSTTFTITVSPASVTVAGPFSITGVTTVSCTTTSAGQRQLTFTPLYGGVNGQTISFRVVNEMLPTTAPGPYVLNPYIDNSTFALRATQSGTAGEVSFSYNWLAACNGVSPPVNQAPTTTGIANQTGTTGVGFSLNVASSFSDPNGDALVFTATGLPSGLSLSGGTISGAASASGVSTVTVRATDPGSLSVSATFTITVSPASTTTTASFAITSVSTISCTPVTPTRYNISFSPQYAGLSGQPISFSVVNELSPTTASGPYSLQMYTDNKSIVLKAVQSGTAGEASFVYNWFTACTGGARLGTSAETLLDVRVIGNPVQNGQVVVEVRGAAGQPLRVALTDLRGQTISSHQIEAARSLERHSFEVGRQGAGLLLLRASTPTQSRTVKVLRAD